MLLTTPHPTTVVLTHTICCQSLHTFPAAQIPVVKSNLHTRNNKPARMNKAGEKERITYITDKKKKKNNLQRNQPIYNL